jgi:hypothetical protein
MIAVAVIGFVIDATAVRRGGVSSPRRKAALRTSLSGRPTASAA